MKITCKKNDLLEVFGIINSVIPSRSTIPMLQNIKLQAQDDKLMLIGTDLEVGIKSEIKAEIKENGVLLIPTQRLGTIIRETIDENIRIETQNNIVHLITCDGDFKIVGADPADYPDFPEFDSKKAIEIEAKGLKEMIHKTIFAVSNEITRYSFNGLLIEFKGKEIRMVGSDGHRMAFMKRHSDRPISHDKKVIVPAKGMNLLERILKDDQKLTMIIDDTQVKFSLLPAKEKYQETTIFSRLVEGTFPDYENIIPTDCDKKLEVKNEELYGALRLVTVVTTDKFKATKFSLKDNKITLTSRTQDVGEAKVEVDAKYIGQPVEIVFNPDFLIDVLRVLGEGILTIELKDKTSPAVFKQGKDYLYLVMPMTIDS
jgi:DNA polymerase-3 subunit beta